MEDRWGFPLKPYGIQEEFMDKMYDCIDNGMFGMFESPTGTGKTLSLICSSMRWIKNQENTVSNDQEPDWLVMHRKKIKISRNTRTDRNHESYLTKEKMHDNNGFKVIFCSRTHSQLSQVVSEFKKTKHSQWANAIIVGSRNIYCIHDKIRRIENTYVKTERCIELQKTVNGCPIFQNRSLDNLSDDILNKTMDIEDAINVSKDLKTCPYYFARSMMASSKFISVPYQLILEKSSRERIGISLKNSIVIFDEAHNLVDSIKNIYNAEINERDATLLANTLNKYLLRYERLFSGPSLFHINLLKNTISGIVKLFCSKAFDGSGTVSTTNEILSAVTNDSINTFKIKEFVDESKLAFKLSTFAEPNTFSSSLLTDVLDFMTSLCMTKTSGKVILCRNKENIKTVRYMVLHCRDYFEDILNESRSVILSGGTMSPQEDILFQLFSGVDKSRIVKFTSGHIVPPSNFLFYNITHGPGGKLLTFKHANMDDIGLINELGLSILNYTRIIPGGIVVFFPSYSMLESMLDAWKTQVLNDIAKRKKVFREQKNMDVNKTIRSFMASNDSKTDNKLTGSILFAVVSGNLSEGINFKDHHGRGIFIVGVPYPDMKSIEMREQKIYYNKYRESGTDDDEYVTNIVLRNVNQCIGRALRHKDDYSVILLIDIRYSVPRIASKLTHWLLPYLKSVKFEKSITNISKFYRERRKQAEDGILHPE